MHKLSLLLVINLILADFSFAKQSETTVDDILEISQQLDTNTIGDLLKRLPKHFRRNFLLSFRSLSSQYADPINPRVFLFNSSTVITFNGKRDSRGYDQIEMHDLRNPEPTYYSLTFTDHEVKWEKNPEVCKGCHGVNLKPIWPTVSIQPWWSNFYGSGATRPFRREEEALFSPDFS